MLRDCGAIMRAAVEGIMMLLLARAEMRKEFEAEERTMVAARDNNPLKLMSDPHEAMDFLFDPAERTDGFLDPVQAVGDACEDLRSHDLALMAGMRAAILGALRRFDPPAIERAFEKSAKGFSLSSRKAQLWEAFVAQQDKLSRDAQEDFNKVFGRDFMGAYQAQLRRLKGGR
jgi:type VI secretion system FHA domain protein